jgi:peptidoglycan/LPS O-acetylase OafA/YrhL
LNYLPAVDGLRALAVLAVLFYHAGYSWMPGGFLGVEVFFVISGYLVTSLLLSEYRREGGIDLRRFWRRRFWRLYPATFVAVVATMVYTAVFLPGELAGLRDDALGALLFGSNWQQLVSDGSYFSEFGRPPLVRHFWSLAVEWQFYLVWPLVALGALRWTGRGGLAALAVAVGAGSTVLMAVLSAPGGDPSRVYYGTDTRLGGLMAGALLATTWSNSAVAHLRAWQVRVLEGAGAVGLAALVFAAVTVHELDDRLYRGGFAAVAALTALVLLSATNVAARWTQCVLGTGPLRWVGLRSYSLYLWHWPVFMVTRPGSDIDLAEGWLIPLRFGLAFVLAEVSYRFVEEPFRRGWRPWQAIARRPKTGAFSLRWSTGMLSVAAGAISGGVLTVFATVVVTAEEPGLPSYLPAESVNAVFTVEPGTPLVPTATATPSPYLPGTGAPPVPSDPDSLAPAATPTASPEPTGVTTAPEPASPEPATPTATPSPEPADGGSVPVSSTVPPTPVRSAAEPEAPAATPEPTPPPPPAPAGVNVSGIGDSVMLGAASALPYAVGTIAVDAAVSRQVSAGIEVLRAWRDAGNLGQVVIIHLGNNGTFTAGQFDEIMAIAGDRTVVFVTLVVPRPWEAGNNEVIRAGVARYGNARLADWASYAGGRAEYFVSDGIHLTGAGAQAYAYLIASAIGG